MEPTFTSAHDGSALRVKLVADAKTRWAIFANDMHQRPVYPRAGDRGPFLLIELMTEQGVEIGLPCRDMVRLAEELIRSRVASVRAELALMQRE